MKLRNRTLFIVTFCTLLFLLAASPDLIHYPLLTLINLSISCAILTIYLLYVAIIKHIERLNQSLKAFNKSKGLSDPSEVTPKDEIVSITNEVQLLQDYVSLSQQHLTQEITEHTKTLEEKNTQLQQTIHDKERANKKLMQDKEDLIHIARYDDLTALPNRIFFNEVLNKAMNHAKRHKKTLAILMIDIDQFNKVKAVLDPTKSDTVLKELSRRFANVLRSEDILAKLDGDEFIVLLNDLQKPKFASAVAEKLLKVCSHLLKIDAHEFILTASIGICIYPNDGNSLEDILKSADDALFKVKHAGGNSYQFYTPEMDIEAREYIQLESALRKALHNNELALYYQPKLHIKKGKIVGLETLMRWEHPVLGIISPAKFIPLAEETGLIMEIGEWALRHACRTNKYWQDEGYEHMTVAVNLSSKQFYHPDITKMISNVLKSTGLNPTYLELEIAENAVMGNMEVAEKILNDMKAIGVQISIDHFGMGYTSISYLKQFPINVIKIDQNYIKGVPNNPNDSAITNAMITLAHNLGLEVVAEGVETAEQVQYLSNSQCDMVQGYYLSHPVPAQKIILQLRKLNETVLM